MIFIGILIGLFIGTFLGIVLTALMTASKRDDMVRDYEAEYNRRLKEIKEV